MRLDGKKFLLALLFVALFAFVSVGAFAQQDEEIQMLWDDGHEQYHHSGLNSILISDLEGQGVVVDAVSTELNTSLLSDYSILVITSPAGPLSPDEISAVTQFVKDGGGLILTGDVQYDGNTFGQPDSLNAILESLEIADKVKFWGTNDLGDEIYDDASKVLSGWQVVVENKYFTPHTIAVGIKKVAINSASLEATSEAVMATSPPTSYTLDVNQDEGDAPRRSGKIPWLAALEVEKGKVVICGSSKMFSDREVYGTGQAYIDYEDNEKLFFNFIWWITGQRLVAPVGITTFFPFLDVFGIVAGIVAFYNFKGDMGKVGKYTALVGIYYVAVAVCQLLLVGNIVFGTLGWGRVSVSLTAENLPFEAVPVWGVAAARYFFSGFLWCGAGAVLSMIVLRVVAKKE